MPLTFIFDTETTGLPKSRGYGHTPDYTELDKYSECRIVQIAWLVCDNKGEVKTQNSFLIKPLGYTIPEESTKIHGITNQMAIDKGIPFELMVSEMMAVFHDWKPNKIVSHNLQFDLNVLLSELMRKNYQNLIEHIKGMKKTCTMVTGKPLCNIRNGNWVKYPKLPELYKYLFEEEMEVKHEAMYDTQMCAKCYIELRKRIKKNQ